MPESPAHTLFSFGTLVDERVQTALFGRAVPTSPASLAGYTTRPLQITDPAAIAASGLDVHLILERRLGASVECAVLHLTDRELAAADAYEVDDCTRRCAGTAGCSPTGCTPPPRATGSSTGTSVP
ncbi:gamma-glutamylcyclotransferase family protein [Streptomyces sp. NPDC085639]|uniref:gamma-glutamylcyclotransferase family protein n=1 Tax=Streptomyces sp. NPDC085639 TaxID=3365734 RepID=UPI0037CF748A